MKLRIKWILALSVLLLLVGVNLAQSNQRAIIALWTFTNDVEFRDGQGVEADLNRTASPATLIMRNQDIDRNGKEGRAFVNDCNILFDGTRSAAWDDVKTGGSDGELILQISSIDWQSLSIRFDYKTQDVDSYDLSYRIPNQDWVRYRDDLPLRSNDDWQNEEVNMTDVANLDNQVDVQLRISDLDKNGNGVFQIDNIAIIGQRISTPVDCPPTVSHITDGIVVDLSRVQTFVNENGFLFHVADDTTPLDNITIEAISSNPNVINQLGLVAVEPVKGLYRLDIGNPHGAVGVADISIRVTDSAGLVAVETFPYAVSNNPAGGNTLYMTGGASGSAGVALDDTYMLVADDDSQIIHLYNRTTSGKPLRSIDMSPYLNLRDTSSDGAIRDLDIEGATRIGNRVFWLTSHSNRDSGSASPNRYRLFAIDVSGQGASIDFDFVGFYGGLRDDLIAWGQSHSYRFSNAAEDGKNPLNAEGFNIEAFSIAPNQVNAYIGFRAPLVGDNKAVIAVLENFVGWFNNGVPNTRPQIGNPIELDLGGRGIRAMECNSNECLIVAGSSSDDPNFAIYVWSGFAGDTLFLRQVDLSGLTPEGVIIPPNTDFSAGSTVQLLSDNGLSDWYGTGIVLNEYPAAIQQFRVDTVVLGE